jgi:hypothetical protein
MVHLVCSCYLQDEDNESHQQKSIETPESNQIPTNQIKSNPNKSNQIKSNQIETN